MELFRCRGVVWKIPLRPFLAIPPSTNPFANYFILTNPHRFNVRVIPRGHIHFLSTSNKHSATSASKPKVNVAPITAKVQRINSIQFISAPLQDHAMKHLGNKKLVVALLVLWHVVRQENTYTTTTHHQTNEGILYQSILFVFHTLPHAQGESQGDTTT